jgi:hypothetical protein
MGDAERAQWVARRRASIGAREQRAFAETRTASLEIDELG